MGPKSQVVTMTKAIVLINQFVHARSQHFSAAQRQLSVCVSTQVHQSPLRAKSAKQEHVFTHRAYNSIYFAGSLSQTKNDLKLRPHFGLSTRVHFCCYGHVMTQSSSLISLFTCMYVCAFVRYFFCKIESQHSTNDSYFIYAISMFSKNQKRI